jgi:hypothetical protein
MLVIIKYRLRFTKIIFKLESRDCINSNAAQNENDNTNWQSIKKCV